MPHVFELTRDGDLDALKRLQAEGRLDLNVRDKSGATLLHAAAEYGHASVVAWLVENGADPNAADGDGETPLHKAPSAVYYEFEQLILRSLDPDKYDDTAQHWTTRNGARDVMSLLIEHGADPNIMNDRGCTPLYAAVNVGQLDFDAAINVGQLDLVRLLLECGADPGTADENCRTLLHLAASKCDVDVVQLLIGSGLDPNAETKFGVTPLHEAVTGSHIAAGRLYVVRILLENGADPNAADVYGVTPRERAAQYEHLDAARLLEEHSGLRDAADDSGQTSG